MAKTLHCAVCRTQLASGVSNLRHPEHFVHTFMHIWGWGRGGEGEEEEAEVRRLDVL
jgi:hypothetical protein